MRTWPLAAGETRIGRSSDLEVSLPDRSVSRLHALVRRDGDILILEDSGSRNGTTVNGIRVRAPQRLNPNDQVAFGNVALSVQVDDQPVQPAFREDVQLDSTFRLNWMELRPAQEKTDGVDLSQILMDMGEFLVRHQPEEEIFRACLDTVERVVPFHRACLLLLDEDGQPVMRAARSKGENPNVQLALSQTMVQTVITERASLLVHDAQADQRFQAQASVILGKIRSALVAPLFDNTRVIGVLYVDSTEFTQPYHKDHLRHLALLANILAVKITNARLLDMQREKDRMQQEMETARRIQRDLLPHALEAPPGYELCARLEPSTEVGGDLYDVLPLPNGSFAFVLGDVVGHGVGAALLMANALAGVRSLAELCLDPLDLVKRLDAQMYRSTDAMSYCTMFVGILDAKRHRLHYVNAGHEPPVIVVPNGATQHLASTGPPVGLLPGAEFETGSVEIPPGGLLAAWSDGIPEAHIVREDAQPDMFGDHESVPSILASLQDRAIDTIPNEIFARVDSFLDGNGAPDDRTLLLLRRLD
ncbi:MAG TPA: SpoIIE family protein phosphatase [Candidatus Krumholzibacteria bacterium]|nr:SpoIIE family protein phosphatase [Candidatus Krumholzibacteria bacterium]